LLAADALVLVLRCTIIRWRPVAAIRATRLSACERVSLPGEDSLWSGEEPRPVLKLDHLVVVDEEIFLCAGGDAE
jgi:hypothetical protein